MTLYFFILFFIGTCFGSFSTVLMSRWKEQKGGILFGRSECPTCHHTLTWIELIPLFSWIFQGRKCKNCHTKISAFYPMTEFFMGILFVLAGYINLETGWIPSDPGYFILFFIVFITGIYIIYDIRYMEIPDQVMIPGIYGMCILLIIGYFFPNIELLFDRGTYADSLSYIRDHLVGAWILYTFFFLQIFIPGTYFFLKQKKYKNIFGLFMSYILFPFTLLITQKEENEEEIPAWIGGGDLRIALFIGITLGTVHGIVSIFCAYILGSIYGVALMIYSAIHKKKSPREIPFGPFLGAGFLITIIFHSEILGYFMNI